jgi:hypothetical protein
MNWKPIASAPRDGTLVRVGWKEPTDTKMQEHFVMQWGHIQRNGLVGDHVGMWVSPCGGFTWSEADQDGAPTHWCELEDEMANQGANQ